VTDRLAYSARLVRKSLAVGSRLCVLAAQAEARTLSQHLWSARSTDFVPHALAGQSSEATLESSYIVIGASVTVVSHHEVLLNLLPEVPAGFERFDRLIELVGVDGADRAAGRLRWKHYQSRGYPLRTHSAAMSATPS
jgi:DNA polymerase-3 subunit chi